MESLSRFSTRSTIPTVRVDSSSSGADLKFWHHEMMGGDGDSRLQVTGTAQLGPAESKRNDQSYRRDVYEYDSRLYEYTALLVKHRVVVDNFLLYYVVF